MTTNNDDPIPCPDCGKELVLQPSPEHWKSGRSFVLLCEDYPRCRGLMSLDDYGNPLGIPADKETRLLRSECHKLFDPLWKKKRLGRDRSAWYKWLADSLHITEEDCHFAKFDKERCEKALKKIKLIRRFLLVFS